MSTIPHKQCSRCERELAISPENFHRSKKSPDGFRSECKKCRVPDSRSYYERNAEKIIANVSEWQKQNYDKWYEYAKKSRAKNPEPLRFRVKQYAKNNPDKRAAHDAVKYAVRKGYIPAAKDCQCIECGQAAEHYHHWSYKREHRLDVIPLCSKCHKQIHIEDVIE